TGTFDSRNVGTDRTVTLASSYSGADAGNYVFVDQASTTASITPKALTVVNLLALDKVYDGTTHASINVSLAILNGIIADDDVALAELSGQFADRNVGQNITVTTGQPTLTGEHAGNYTIEPISTLAASITPRDLAVTATALDKMFDGTLNANVTIGDNRIRLEDELLYDFTSRFVSAEPGQNRLVLVTEILLGGADAGNYRLLNTAATTFANIRPLSIFDQLPNAEQIIVDSQANAQLTAESPVTKVVPPQLLAKPSPQGPGMAPGVRFVSVNEPSASLAAQFEPGAGLQLVAQPRPGEQTATVTLSEVAEMVALPEEAGVDSSRERRRIRVPLNNRSLVDVVDGGVALPEGVEQIMFVTKR
ncbi:MAG: YDG domain-containing protein, partial [Marinobacter sp.]|nr:YDG domain-containing protein [Marinobacter sp.]